MLLGETIEQIDVAWRRLWETIGVAGDRDLERPGPDGGWSVKDVLGHLAFWEERALQRARGAAPIAFDDIDSLNAEQVEARRMLSAAQVRADLERGHDELLSALDSLTPLQLEEGTAPGGWLTVNTWEHYDEHREQIAAILPHA